MWKDLVEERRVTVKIRTDSKGRSKDHEARRTESGSVQFY